MALIIGTGHHLPDHVLDNAALAATIGHDDAWIMQRTGIRERRIAEPGTATAALGEAAARQALDDTGISGSDLDIVIVATSTPDHLTPPTACEVQAALGARAAAAFDIEAGFAGWIYALVVADALIVGGTAACALVVGAEKLSSVTDRSDPATAPLFGDGAGAVVLAGRDSGAANRRGGLSDNVGAGIRPAWRLGERSWWADGRLARALRRPGGGSMQPFDLAVLEDRRHLLRMEGTRLFRQAVRTMAGQARAVLAAADLDVGDIDLVVPHQANLRILQAFAQEMDLPIERVFINIEHYGNTGSATVPIALDQALRGAAGERDSPDGPAGRGLPHGRGGPAGREGSAGREGPAGRGDDRQSVRDVSRILLVSFGAGATAGAMLLERG